MLLYVIRYYYVLLCIIIYYYILLHITIYIYYMYIHIILYNMYILYTYSNISIICAMTVYLELDSTYNFYKPIVST